MQWLLCVTIAVAVTVIVIIIVVVVVVVVRVDIINDLIVWGLAGGITKSHVLSLGAR